MTVAKLRVRLVKGDLTELEVDGIVNPANSLGEMGGGVAGAIRKKGGPKIEREAMARAPIPIGRAVATTSGNLRCRAVIHAPTMSGPAELTDVEKIKKATFGALECADEAGLSTLAFPGMGTGVGRVEPHQAAEAMAEVVRNFHPKSLKEVLFVAYGEELQQAFEKALRS